jgi:tetratricopeptide (TPR) repeat protein
MDWTTLLRSQQADFIQKLKTPTLNAIQRLSKLTLSIFLALLISMTGVVVPGVPLTSEAEALPINKALPPSRVKNTARGLQTDSNFVTSWSSFLSDNSIFRNTLELAFVSTAMPIFAPNFAPILSLFRFDFYFDIKEFNLVNIINSQPDNTSPALESYKQGVEKTQQGDYKGAVKYYTEALKKDHNLAEAYVSRGRAYSELGDQQRAYEYQQLAIKDYTSLTSAIAEAVVDTILINSVSS